MEKKIQELEKENKQLKVKIARLESDKKESVKATFKKTYTSTSKKGLELVLDKEQATKQLDYAKKTQKIVGTLGQLETKKIDIIETKYYTLELNKKKAGK